jgi:hypothetical protein
MSASAEIKAASYFGPLASATPTAANSGPGNNPCRRPTSTANTSEALATRALQDGRTIAIWAGKYVDITNEDLVNPVEVAFSVAAQTLVYGQVGTFAAGSAAAGMRIQPGQTKGVIVPPTALYANWIQPAAAPASTIEFHCSEGNIEGIA